MKNYILIVLIGLCFGCSDFLEPDSPTEYTPETTDHLNEMLLSDAYLTNTNTGFVGLLELVTDDVTTVGYIKSEDERIIGNPYQDIQWQAYKSVYTWQPNYSRVMTDNGRNQVDFYSPYYNKLIGTNICFDLIDDVSGTEAEKAFVLAQAYALRAFHYLMLVNIYGTPYNVDKTALGVPIRTTAKIEDKAFIRNTVEEVYERILTDALEAEKCFEKVESSLYFKRDYRVNLPMVQLLLARIYLYMENWEKAAEYAKLVIAWDEFSLIDLNTLESVVENTGHYNFITYLSSNSEPKRAGSESIWVFGAPNDLSVNRSVLVTEEKTIKFFQASPSLINNYEEGDLRLNYYFSKETSQDDREGVRTGYRAYGKIVLSNQGELPTGSSEFGRAFRLSEAYLIVAEANAMMYKETGNTSIGQEAAAYLDELRIKRFTPDTYEPVFWTNADDVVELVRNERRRELCYEVHRWFDLRRWGMPEITHEWIPGSESTPSPYQQSYTLTKGDLSYTFPLPHDVLELNTNLEQNPLAPVRGAN